MLKPYGLADSDILTGTLPSTPFSSSLSNQGNVEPIMDDKARDYLDPLPLDVAEKPAHANDSNAHNIEADSTPSCDPTPIQLDAIEVVDAVPVAATSWCHDFDFDILISMLATEKKIQDEVHSAPETSYLSKAHHDGPSWKRQRLDTDSCSTSCSNSSNHSPARNLSPSLNNVAIPDFPNQIQDIHGDLMRATPHSSPSPSSGLSSAAADQNCRFRPDQAEQWSERFQQLLDFRQAHGHCHVSWSEYPFLAQWIKRQRYQYRLKQEGRHCTLTDERVVALKQIGFIWDSHKAAWEERFNDLQCFKKKFGHCNVPSVFPENHQLAVWVKSQRRQHKLFKSGQKSKITSDRITKLTDLGFMWCLRKPK